MYYVLFVVVKGTYNSLLRLMIASIIRKEKVRERIN